MKNLTLIHIITVILYATHVVKLFCLESIKSPDLTTLKDYDVKELKLIIEGYCKECRV